MLNSTDLKIIEELKKNARVPLKEISLNVNLSISAVSERIRRLERDGYIKQYTAIVDDDLIKKQCSYYCLITLAHGADQSDEFLRKTLAKYDEIISFYRILGPYEYLMNIKTNSPQDLEKLITSLRKEIGVANSLSCTVLSSLKSNTPQ